MPNDHSPNSDGNSHGRPSEPNGGLQSEVPEFRRATGSPPITRFTTRNWIALSGVVVPTAVVALFLILWFVRRDPIPRDIPVATSRNGSSYHVFGTEFCEVLNRQLVSQRGRVVETSGSGQNIQMLQSQTTRLAMYQGGTVELSAAAIVAPLYREVVHVLIKNEVFDNAKYEGREPTGDVLRDLLIGDGGEVYAGAGTSGMRHSAREILDHYGIDAEEVQFTDEETQSTEVVISTTGMFSKAMENRLKGGDYRYIALDSEAISNRHTHFVTHKIPKASYRDLNGQPVPDQDISTVATTAYFVVRQDASPRLVNAALDALYQGDLGREHPDLIPRNEARRYLHGMPVHVTAQTFFEPYDIAYLAGLVESLAATKELLVALGAGVYLLWTIRRRRQDRLRDAEMLANRGRLDQFVDQTIAIESTQIGETDPKRLTEYLEEVTQIKLKALDELTDAELRGDRAFSIFLMQCANLISKLQLKIITYTRETTTEE